MFVHASISILHKNEYTIIYVYLNPFLLVCSQEGTYAYQDENGSLALLSGIPSALVSCQRMGELPGCLFKFDDPDSQCADGRRGKTL